MRSTDLTQVDYLFPEYKTIVEGLLPTTGVYVWAGHSEDGRFAGFSRRRFEQRIWVAEGMEQVAEMLIGLQQQISAALIYQVAESMSTSAPHRKITFED